MSPNPKRIILAISGASGAMLGIRALELLKTAGIETHLIISKAGRQTIQTETSWKIKDVESLASWFYPPDQIGAQIASGSFTTDGMLVAPCSIKTLSGIANSYSDNLVVRAADVCLKEGRPVVLAVREAPLHTGHLRLMKMASRAGAVIFPPVPAFYNGAQTVDEMITQMVGRMLMRLGVHNEAYGHWGGIENQ
jgi:flavin prenyltransferase